MYSLRKMSIFCKRNLDSNLKSCTIILTEPTTPLMFHAQPGGTFSFMGGSRLCISIQIELPAHNCVRRRAAEGGKNVKKSFFELLFVTVSAILYLNEEGRGRSAHGLSSQMRVWLTLPNRRHAEKRAAITKKSLHIGM